MQIDSNISFSIPTIDVPATSHNLKTLREKRNISVARIQKLLGMENPQSIYTWEDPEKKYLPRIDNLVILAKLYKVTLDELIVIKKENHPGLILNEPSACYGISKASLLFIAQTAGKTTKPAIENYYNVYL